MKYQFHSWSVGWTKLFLLFIYIWSGPGMLVCFGGNEDISHRCRLCSLLRWQDDPHLCRDWTADHGVIQPRGFLASRLPSLVFWRGSRRPAVIACLKCDAENDCLGAGRRWGECNWARLGRVNQLGKLQCQLECEVGWYGIMTSACWNGMITACSTQIILALGISGACVLK